MKIRQGFVSNSSSSSFIVAFPNTPQSAEEVKQLLFNKEETFPSTYGDEIFSTKALADRIFSDMVKPASMEELEEEITYGYFEGAPQMDWKKYYKIKSEEEEREFLEELNIKERVYSKKLLEDFTENNQDKIFYIFEYSDNSGGGEFETTLEHGYVFERLPNIMISKH